MAYPNSLDSFTTKTDDIDDVMAADINSIQSAVAAVETELGTLPKGTFTSLVARLNAGDTELGVSPKGLFTDVATRLAAAEGGYFRMATTGTYVSATSFTLVGDLTAFFKIGTKIRLVNSSVKYGICLSSSFAGGITTINLVPNTSFSLANAAITNIDISYGYPPDFPFWFEYLSTLSGDTGTAGTYAETLYASKFSASGRKMNIDVNKLITNLGSWAGSVHIALPITTTVFKYGGGEVIAHGQLARKGNLYSASSTSAAFEKNVGTAFLTWADMAVNDHVIISGEFEI